MSKISVGNVSDYRLISQPIRIHWMGWETDTARLAENGWDISVDQNLQHRSMEIAIRKNSERGQSIYGMTEMKEFEYHRYLHNYHPHEYVYPLFKMLLAYEIIINERYVRAKEFSAVNAHPSYMEVNNSMDRIENLIHFQKIKQDTKQIILQRASMQEVLEFALSKQAPEQERIRKEMLKRQEMERFKQASEVKAELLMAI